MSSVSIRRDLARIHADRQRRRWLRRTWTYITGLRPRGVRAAAQEFRAWLITLREDLP